MRLVGSVVCRSNFERVVRRISYRLIDVNVARKAARLVTLYDEQRDDLQSGGAFPVTISRPFLIFMARLDGLAPGKPEDPSCAPMARARFAKRRRHPICLF